MTPQEEQHFEHYFNEFQALVLQARTKELGGEPEFWLGWGYERSLQQEQLQVSLSDLLSSAQQELVQLAYELAVDQTVNERPLESQAWMYLGVGFFYGLRRNQQISAVLYERLRYRLPQWLDTLEHYQNLLSQLFDPDVPHDQQLILRQRSHLVQALRKRNYPRWQEVHRALFQPHDFLEHERQGLLDEVSRFLLPTELETLTLLGKGAFYPISRKF